jgi:hypothetical protein
MNKDSQLLSWQHASSGDLSVCASTRASSLSGYRIGWSLILVCFKSEQRFVDGQTTIILLSESFTSTRELLSRKHGLKS